jgi:hypothetical protein
VITCIAAIVVSSARWNFVERRKKMVWGLTNNTRWLYNIGGIIPCCTTRITTVNLRRLHSLPGCGIRKQLHCCHLCLLLLEHAGKAWRMVQSVVALATWRKFTAKLFTANGNW